MVYTDYRPTPLQHYVFPAGGAQVAAPMWASRGADVGESRCRCGRVAVQMWTSPGADVGESRCRCLRVAAPMWASRGADVGHVNQACACA